MKGPFEPAPLGRPPGHGANHRPIASGLRLGAAQDELIDRSHERCVARGLSRIAAPDHAGLARADLLLLRERNLKLHLHAAPVMELLHEQIAGTQSMVVLTDATGTVLASIGDGDFLARASRVALAPGADWSEAAKGTNAVGTALVSERPTLVHADEHFLHANHFLTCSAAPILDPRGSILGVLDVSGDHRSYHPHTMALVKMSARMIENHCLTDDCHHAMRLHFHRRIEFIGTLMEGILAIDADGRILGANRGALEQLGLSGAALRQRSLQTLFGTGCAPLVDHFRSPLAAPLLLHTAPGQGFHVHARINWPVWSAPGAGGGLRHPAPIDAAAAPTPQAATPAATPSRPATPREAGPVAPTTPSAPHDGAQTLQDLEMAAIRRALDEASGNVAAAARRLGISRNTIYRRLQRHAPH